MNIGLYFGSFNPIHHGHLIIAAHVLNETSTDELWFVLSPQNPLKKSSTLLNEHDRLHLVQLAIDKEPKMRASTVEFSMPKPSYTIDTLTYLSEKYPHHTFTVIMGGDSYTNIKKWKNYKDLVEKYQILIYNRPNFLIKETTEKAEVLDAPLLEISSTTIRTLVKAGKNVRFLLPEKVKDYIEENNYYKN
jgi:nicotinate-nucleotide adenylyltransferase